MGLDTSHDCWHGAYGAFSRWRERLARVAGYEIAKVTWEGEDIDSFMQGRDQVLIDWGHITEAQVQGEWDDTPADPLIVLIAHSDCDGFIRHPQTKPLAERLTELLPLLPEGEAPGHVRHWRNTTQQFIDGLLLAHEDGEDVEFA